MGGASLNWKRFVEKNISGKSNNECRIFQEIDGNLMLVFVRKISTRNNLFGPFQCPPDLEFWAASLYAMWAGSCMVLTNVVF
jgi:hypothetical protein